MSDEFTLLGYGLEAGSWADWFSGAMSGLAVATALVAYPLARCQRRTEQRQRDEELGRSIGWKLLKVLNHTLDIDRHIKTGLAQRVDLKQPSMKFPLVRPLGLPERTVQELNQSETDLLLKAKAGDLLAEVEMCIGRYLSIVYAMNEYKNRHEALYELMPPPISREGTLFTHELTQEERRRVDPYAAMLEALLDGTIALIEENVASTKHALSLYITDMRRYFKKDLVKIELKPEAA